MPDAMLDAMPDAMLDWNGDTTVTATKFGFPVWTVVSWSHYSGRIGSSALGFVSYHHTLQDIWTNHLYYPEFNLLGPDEVHPPPYDSELLDGLAANGINPGHKFHVADWTAPMGLILSACIVPGEGAPIGRSPDFDSGPIIPDSLFPMHIDADLAEGGFLDDGDLDGDQPPISQVLPGTDAQGWSHLPFNIAENTSFIDGHRGGYDYLITMTDATGSGWTFHLTFTIW